MDDLPGLAARMVVAVIYLAIAGYYVVLFGTVGRIAAYQFIYKKKFEIKPVSGQPERGKVKDWLRFKFRTSLVFNDLAGISIILLLFALISALLPADFSSQTTRAVLLSPRRLAAFLIVCVVPYYLAFYRSTSVGIHSSTLGTLLGSNLMVLADPSLVWSQETPFLLLLVLVANASAWVGGAVGKGQVREAIAVSVFEVEVCEEGRCIPALLKVVSDSITRIVRQHDPKINPVEQKPDLVLAQISKPGGRFASLLSMKQKISWTIAFRPQEIARAWYGDKREEFHDPNEIMDHISNVWRFIRIEAQFSHSPHPEAQEKASRLRVSVLAYKETPSIIWVDADTEKIAADITAGLKQALGGSANAGGPAADHSWRLANASNFILRKWPTTPNLEQYSKHTYATGDAAETLTESRFEFEDPIPDQMVDELVEVPSFFGRMRGKFYIFLAFLVGQVLLGISINWLSNQLFNRGNFCMQIAITRLVSPSIAECELTYLQRTPIDYRLACQQHEQYCAALADLGCQVITLPAEADLPDSVFVEDAALVLDELAVLTRPGAASRRPEVELLRPRLAEFRRLEQIEAPGTLEGGDILRLGRDLYVGLSGRSNPDGIAQLAALLEPAGYRVHPVPVSGCLHLKSAVSQVAAGTLLANPAWVDPGLFLGWRWLAVDPAEPDAANALLVGGGLIYPAAFPLSLRRLEQAGLDVRVVDASEVQKAEGAVTCCSLVFEENLAE